MIIRSIAFAIPNTSIAMLSEVDGAPYGNTVVYTSAGQSDSVHKEPFESSTLKRHD